MTVRFRTASRKQAKARVGLVGPSGSGKTYTSLVIAQELGEKVYLIDSENKSADHYGNDFRFEKCDLMRFRPQDYVEAIRAAEEEGADVIIVDSLSHAWAGTDGALSMVDDAMARCGGNKWAAWREVTPEHNRLVDAIVRCRCHIICTMRAKTAYEVTRNDDGKAVPIKIGLAPVQRDGMEYEFDLVADMDYAHRFIVSKTRLRVLDKAVMKEPDASLGRTIREWLDSGKPVEEEALASETEIKAVFRLGKSLGLTRTAMQEALRAVTGRSSTGRLSASELVDWKTAVETWDAEGGSDGKAVAQ